MATNEQTQMVAAAGAAALAIPSANLTALYPEPGEWAMMKEMAAYVLASGLMPDNIKKMADPVSAATTIMLQGRELGVAPMRALYDIYVVNGRPSCGTDLMMAMVARENAGYIVTLEEYWDGTDKSFIKRKAVRPGRPDEEYTFTWGDAKKAGLTGKDVWQKFGPQMMEHRCTSILARRVWPDITRGMYTPDEAEDIGAEPVPFIESTPATAEVQEAEFGPVAATLGEDGVKEFNETARSLVAGYPALQTNLAQDVKRYLKREFDVDRTADLPVAGVPKVMAFIGSLVRAQVESGVAAPPPADPTPQDPPGEAAPSDLQAQWLDAAQASGMDPEKADKRWGQLSGKGAGAIGEDIARLRRMAPPAEEPATQEGMTFSE